MDGVRLHRDGLHVEIDALHVWPGQVIGVAGGAGKSAVAELVVGKARPDEGMVRVFGVVPSERIQFVRKRIGYLAAELPMFDLEIDKLLRFVSGTYPGWDPMLAKQLVRQYGLDPTARPSSLAGADKIWLRLLLALSFRPTLVVLDNPAEDLEPAEWMAIIAEVLAVISDPKRAVLVTATDPDDLEGLVDELHQL